MGLRIPPPPSELFADDAEQEEYKEAIHEATQEAFNRLLRLIVQSTSHCPLKMGLHCVVCDMAKNCSGARKIWELVEK